MRFYQFFIIFICNTYLILFNAFTATADESYKLTLTTTAKNSTCRSRPINENASSSTTQCMAGYPFEEFPITCTPDPKLDDDHTIVWYKKSKSEPETLVESNERILIRSNDLIFKSLDVVDAAPQYQCRVVKKGDGNANTQPISQRSVELIIKPRVSLLKKELNVIEGENVTLTCAVTTNVPTVTVKWIIDTPYWTNKTFDKSNERIELRSNGNGSIFNNELIIKSANMSLDRGLYTCSADSEEGSSIGGTPFMVRVKSKYAALWPFLGICTEVFILCAVILVYERKRDKTELEESDTDQGPETKSSPDHGQDNVRYRK